MPCNLHLHLLIYNTEDMKHLCDLSTKETKSFEMSYNDAAPLS